MGKLLMAVFALVLATGPAFGTVSRDTALMGEGWKFADSANSGMFPSTVLGYRDVFYGELGATSVSADSYGVLNLSLGQALLSVSAGNITLRGASMDLLALANVPTVAIGSVPSADVLHSNYDADAVTPGVQTLAGDGTVAPDPRLSVLVGMDAGQNAKVAFGVEYAGRTWEDSRYAGPVSGGSQTTIHKNSASVVNVVAGVGVEPGPGNQVELGFVAGMPTFYGRTRDSDTNITHKYASDGGYDLQLNARVKVTGATGKRDEMFLMFTVERATLGGKSSGSAWTDGVKDLDGSAVGIGLANNFRVTESTMVIASIEYQTMGLDTTVVMKDYATPDPDKNDLTTKQEESGSMIPVTFGVESKVLSWLKVRMSSRSSLLNSQARSAALRNKIDGTLIIRNRIASESSSQDFTLGLELAATDKLKIDGVLSEQLVFDGPYFVTGNAIAQTFSGVSASLRF